MAITRGQRARRDQQFRKGIVDELLATRPQACTVRANQQLGANAVPLPFGLPVVDRSQRRQFALERMREKEGVRAMRRRFGMGRIGANLLQESRRWGPAADQPVGDLRDGDTGGLGESPVDELFRRADAEGAGDELGEYETRVAIEAIPRGDQADLHFSRTQRSEWASSWPTHWASERSSMSSGGGSTREMVSAKSPTAS